jgi:hypothetical protein
VDQILDSAGIQNNGTNFEALYSGLVTSGGHQELIAEIEKRLFDYFSVLELPELPTVYDYVVLSLREKDLIATFNWDPFLVQAIIRNQHVGPMPRTLFLHGNVAVAYRLDHDPVLQCERRDGCPECGSTLTNAPLLYPVADKNYQQSQLIDTAWQIVQEELRAAFLLTIFGYSAPSADVEAVRLLKEAWDPASSQQNKTLEIIDIRKSDDLRETWRPFFPSTYYNFHKQFRGSWLDRYPRRSCESVFIGQMYGPIAEPESIPLNLSLPDLQAWFSSQINAEQRCGEGDRRG